MPKKQGPEVRHVNLEEARAVLQEVQSHLTPEKHALLVGLVETYAVLVEQLSSERVNLARLRKLFGLCTSERLPPRGVAPEAAASEPAAAPKDAATGSGGEPRVSEETSPIPGEPEKKKGHGRRKAADCKATNTVVPLVGLQVGGCCPDCPHGKLHRLAPAAPTLMIFGQPPFAARSWTPEQARCGSCGRVFTAKLPPEAQGPKHTKSAVATLVSLHYLLGMPFERLAKMQDALGVPLPASVQWELASTHEPFVRPVYEALERAAAQARLIHIDDTHMKILSLVGKRRAKREAAGSLESPERTGLFTTGILTEDDEKRVIAIFKTGRNHAGENLADLLALRAPGVAAPTIMCDALARNVADIAGKHAAEIANCLVHGRRGVFDLLDVFPSLARKPLEDLGRVFEVDARAKRDGLDAVARLRLHQRESGPILGRLRRWLVTQLSRARTVEPNSSLGRAFKYILRHWRRLTLFLRRPGVPLTNNACERLLKVVIRYRKNSSFYLSERGAAVSDVYTSLMQTARLNGEDPFAYLLALLNHPEQVAADPEAWLPWNYRATLAKQQAQETDAAA